MQFYSIIGMLFLFISCSGNTGANPEVRTGRQLFKNYCSNCHGADGSLGVNGAINLQYSNLKLEERKLVISMGRNLMTGFSSKLSPEQIDSVARYTLELKNQAIDAR